MNKSPMPEWCHFPITRRAKTIDFDTFKDLDLSIKRSKSYLPVTHLRILI